MTARANVGDVIGVSLPSHDYCTSVRVGGDLWHGSGHVTRLPLPDSEREALR